MSAFDFANGVLVALVVISAFGVGVKARRATVVLAAVFALNWLHFITSFSDRSLASMLWAEGLNVRNDDLWKIMDALTGVFGIVCAVDGRAWWGWAIWGLSIAQLLAHFTYWEAGMVSARAYYPVLDGLFLAQVGVFIMAGGRGVVSRVGRILDSRRHVGSSPPSARQAA